MEKYLKQMTIQCAKKISDQMENYLYRINKKDGNYEIGYFIQLKDKNGKNYIALVTNSNVLDDIDNNSLKITIDNEPKSIELGEIRYENKAYNKAVDFINQKKIKSRSRLVKYIPQAPSLPDTVYCVPQFRHAQQPTDTLNQQIAQWMRSRNLYGKDFSFVKPR